MTAESRHETEQIKTGKTQKRRLRGEVAHRMGQKVNPSCFSTNCAKMCASEARGVRFEYDKRSITQRYNSFNKSAMVKYSTYNVILDAKLRHW